MGDNVLVGLSKQHRAGQDKYAYFLLAVAASAVGFAVQKTTGVGVQWSQLPLAVATGLWLTSFFFGCRHLLWSQAALYANASLIKLRKGIHPDQPVHPSSDAAIQGVRSAMTQNADDAAFYGKWQFLLLVIGAVFFLVWHVLEMVLLVADDLGG